MDTLSAPPVAHRTATDRVPAVSIVSSVQITTENAMDQHIVVPIAVFVCVAYAFKAVLDAGMRYWILRSGETVERVQAILQGEERQRRLASLRWGIVLVVLAIGFGLIQVLGWKDLSPGVIAVLAATTGLGNLAFFAISRRIY
jgi:hypothetical protein